MEVLTGSFSPPRYVPFPWWKIAFENEKWTTDCISAISQRVKFPSHLMALCHVPDKSEKKKKKKKNPSSPLC